MHHRQQLKMNERQKLAIHSFQTTVELQKLYRKGSTWGLLFNHQLVLCTTDELYRGPASAAFRRAVLRQTGRIFPPVPPRAWGELLRTLFPPVIFHD